MDCHFSPSDQNSRNLVVAILCINQISLSPQVAGKICSAAADNATYPESELLELYRIRGKCGWRELRTAAIEASIISESLLRAYGLQALKASGFSSNKIKRLRDELTFNNLLNIVLPLSLTKTELRKVQRAIDAVDRLRGIRNDLIHGNIVEKDVEAKAVEAGIDGAIQLVRFLQMKLA